ncbi:MAG: NAD(P)-dependent oxidoreductase [Puniceicoccaceae bacterium]|nr:MAG: NAD(P)-dependent oxidoreductase [Puniceicoccaceae bacterium]
MNQTVLVTGATGRVGRRLCRHLADAGHTVRATDLHYAPIEGVKVRVANLLDREVPYELVDGVDAIIHLGNHPSPGRVDAQRTCLENSSMNLHLFQAAAELGVKRIIFASSIQVFGNQRTYPEREKPSHLVRLPLDGSTPPRPANTYGLSKLLGEKMLAYFHDQFGITTVALRFPHILGSYSASRWFRRYTREANEWTNLDEGLTLLCLEDAVTLMAALVQRPASGSHILFPAVSLIPKELKSPQVLRECYPGVEWTVPPEELQDLVDRRELEDLTGWKPVKTIELISEQSDED